MKNSIWWTIVIVLFAAIVVLAWILFTTPVPAHPSGTATSTTAIATVPLHDRVVVDTPKSGATVAGTFSVTGEAPGSWYFEASFPVQVRDPENNKIGQAIAQAQSDWMTTQPVPFKAEITVIGYSGPATLVLLRDNPSGLPENDDSVSVPIVVQ